MLKIIKILVRPVLLSNYSLALSSSDWRAEKIFPRAISATSFQIYLIVISLFVGFYPKLRTQDDFIYFFAEIGLLSFGILFLFRAVITWMYISFHVIQLHRKPNSQPISKSLSLSLIISGLVVLLITIGWRMYLYIS